MAILQIIQFVSQEMMTILFLIAKLYMHTITIFFSHQIICCSVYQNFHVKEIQVHVFKKKKFKLNVKKYKST